MKRYLFLLVAAGIFLAGIYKIETTPPVWWDEGWNLSLARNWVESGYYGRFQAGEPVRAGLSTGFPGIVPIALSFRLFGVGIWQGRLPCVLFMLAALALLFYLAERLYNRRVAAGALAVILLLPGADQLNPILLARQALGEMPAMAYLLAGYVLWYGAAKKTGWLVIPAGIFWGLALNTKAQVLPFWLVSLLLPLAVAVFKRWWRQALLMGAALAGAWAASAVLLPWLQDLITGNFTPAGYPVEGLYGVTAFVPDLQVRLSAILNVLTFALPALLGYGYAVRNLFKKLFQPGLEAGPTLISLALLALGGSWLVWFILLAMAWTRYLFPAVFVGSIFASAWLYDLTGHFDLRFTVRKASQAILKRKFNRETGGALAAVILIAALAPITCMVVNYAFTAMPDSSALQAADYLNRQPAGNGLVETYESELFFLLDQNYHYPPDPVHVQLVRRDILDPGAVVDYDPLAANPGYLVVGRYAGSLHLYDQVLETGAFHLVNTFPRYQIYERVRQ